jgi:hypothetical protein
MYGACMVHNHSRQAAPAKYDDLPIAWLHHMYNSPFIAALAYANVMHVTLTITAH